MSTKSRYANLAKSQRDMAQSIQRKQKEAEKANSDLEALKEKSQNQMDEFINPRLQYLAVVGRSALAKCWGVDYVEPKHTNAWTRWTIYDFTVTKVTPENIYIEGVYKGHSKLFVLSADTFLYLSDRDFAKKIRGWALSAKPYWREQESKKVKAEISKLRHQIRWNEMTIRDLGGVI